MKSVIWGNKNYELIKCTVFGCGLFYGSNKFGSEWIEIKWFGRTVKTVYLLNYNPVKGNRIPATGEVRPALHT